MTRQMRAVLLHRTGGPEQLRPGMIAEPEPAVGQSLVDVTLAGVNFDDLEQRAGSAPLPGLPAVLGVDAVGRRRVDGRRVAVLLRRGGGYAAVVAADDRYTVELPDHIDDAQGSALLEQGGTAYGGLVLAGRLQPGEAVAISAAAGGVGHLAVQLALAYGAHPVIGLASTPAKRALVASLGAHQVLDPAAGPIGEQLRAATDGSGVDLVLDSVGGEPARSALAGVSPFGRLVSIGWRPDKGPFDVSAAELTGGSVGCAGFWMRHVVDDRRRLSAIADELFDLAKRGLLTARIDRVLPLERAADAHRALESRATAGKVLLDLGNGG